jgi:hypothetical protein
MKPRMLLALAMILVLLVAGSAPVAAKDTAGPEVPFKAAFVTHPSVIWSSPGPTFQVDIPAKGQATHLGDNVTWYSLMGVAYGAQWGEMTFTADNGDKVFGEFAGHGVPNSTWTETSYSGTYEFTGGTGRFEGAGGSGIYWGTSGIAVSPNQALGVLYFEGSLIKARQPQCCR